jgi:biotin carboxyl carrier protein
MTAAVLYAEELRVPERLIVAPAGGVFRGVAPETVTTEGEIVAEGQTVGLVCVSGDDVPVRSAFRGWLMGMLAVDGERVREGQPVAWLRAI